MRTQTVTTNIFTFGELDDDAKEKARDWYREGALDYEWWNCVYDDAKEIAVLMGIEIDDIFFSGFTSQGDGAQFTGRYYYKKGSVAAVKAYAPQDETLHAIAQSLVDIQRPRFYQIYASVERHGHYCHAYCTSINVMAEHEMNAPKDVEDAIQEALRDYMNWIYKRLEETHDHLMSDESADDMIMSNEYEFTADGAPT